MKRTWTLPQSSKLFKRFLKIIALVYFYHVWWLNELWFKRYIRTCNLSHVLIPIRASQIWYHHRMIKNTKTWISWEQNITFLPNKKILTCALQSYRFVVEVSFKWPISFKMGKTYSLNSKKLEINYQVNYYFSWPTSSGPSSSLEEPLDKCWKIFF